MNGNLKVGNLFGIPFYVNLSWFLVLALVTWNYGRELAFAFPALGSATPWLLGLMAALLLFASVLAHELGHSFAARRQGIGVNSITLFLFGGLAALEKESTTPRGAFEVAIAGPLVSFILFGLFTLVNLVLPLTGPFAAIVSLLGYINLALGVFNLIPGLPLDGGNVLKAAVWQITGNPYKATRIASRSGQLIGWVAIISGLGSVLGLFPFGSIWNLLIGFFLLQNANRSGQFATVQERLDGLTAEDAVAATSPVVAADATLREFAETVFLAGTSQWQKFLVVNAEGQLAGTLKVDALQRVSRDLWADTAVGDIMEPETMTTVESDQSLLDVVKVLEQNRLQALPVIGENGVLVGLLEKASIQSLVQRTQPNPA
ncbi:site-2 protease family protein [Pseudanabaena sp. FACHB-2040]|uniref:site-2 protease family protein n=1 Tax=Pseudanabaena sp. FACHB-2040 TaxID=2692859 RepID=UPI0016841A8A|nr:site-2 protease family protein [Pseudanabaena sp. FACHB-2040]MBD2256685.1 site-2 protease family protein [Pseudanabaena sp. FACHB-2040]